MNFLPIVVITRNSQPPISAGSISMSFAYANYTSTDSTKVISKIFPQIPENSKKQNRKICHTQAALHKALTLYLQQET